MAAAEERRKSLQLRIASLDLKQAPKLPWVASTGSSVHPTLAEALLREELKLDSAEMVFRNIRVESVGFDKSIKQGGREPTAVQLGDKHTGWDLWWTTRRREEGGHELSTGLDGVEDEGMRVS